MPSVGDAGEHNVQLLWKEGQQCLKSAKNGWKIGQFSKRKREKQKITSRCHSPNTLLSLFTSNIHLFSYLSLKTLYFCSCFFFFNSSYDNHLFFEGDNLGI